jgi:hypothetical protein
MSTDIRPELSKRNKYWIDKNRYYELKHFCLQYKQWKVLYSMLDGAAKRVSDYIPSSVTNKYADPTVKAVAGMVYCGDRIKMVEEAAQRTDADLGGYILTAVTEGRSYESMLTRYSVPCSRDTFYDRYRKFFWILDKLRV